jgi:hypothetical protein
MESEEVEVNTDNGSEMVSGSGEIDIGDADTAVQSFATATITPTGPSSRYPPAIRRRFVQPADDVDPAHAPRSSFDAKPTALRHPTRNTTPPQTMSCTLNQLPNDPPTTASNHTSTHNLTSNRNSHAEGGRNDNLCSSTPTIVPEPRFTTHGESWAMAIRPYLIKG